MKILIALDESPVSARQRERRPACSRWQVPYVVWPSEVGPAADEFSASAREDQKSLHEMSLL